MNIFEEIPFSSEKPAVKLIRKTEQAKYIAIGLQEGQVLPSHKTAVPTTLTVLRGRIRFDLGSEVHEFEPGDVFFIPVDEVHEVTGLEEAVFTLVMG